MFPFGDTIMLERQYANVIYQIHPVITQVAIAERYVSLRSYINMTFSVNMSNYGLPLSEHM